MKKLFTLLLVLALALPALVLADPDVTSMTDQELRDMITACSAELRARTTEETDGTLLFETEGLKLYQIGEPRVSSDYLYIPVAIYNDLDFQVSLSPNVPKINGWEIYSSGASANAKSKKKGELSFKIADADVTALDQIDSFVFGWSVFNMDTWEFPYVSEGEEQRFW